MTPSEREQLRTIQKTPGAVCTMRVCELRSKDGTTPRDCVRLGRCRRRKQSQEGNRFADK